MLKTDASSIKHVRLLSLRATALAVMALLLASADASAAATAVQAQKADAIAASIGVNTHLNWQTSNYYTGYAQVKALLGELGVRQYRSSTATSPTVLAKYKDLYATFGIKGQFTFADYAGDYNTALVPGDINAHYNGFIKDSDVSFIRAIEGPNEYDHSERANWPAELRTYQTALYNKVRSDSRMNGIPVVAPSLVTTEWDTDSSARLGNISSICDRGNMHLYRSNGVQIDATTAAFQFDLLKANFGNKPIDITETGVCTALDKSVMCVSEKAQAKYALRTYMEKSRLDPNSVAFQYEFLDVNQGEKVGWNWGLVRDNFTPRPSFYAIKNLIKILGDKANANFTPGRLAYEIVAPAATQDTIREVLSQKKDGRFYLAVWRNVRLFEHTSSVARELSNGTVPIVINLAQRANVKVFEPTPLGQFSNPSANGTSPVAVINNSSAIPYDLPDHVVIFEITPVSSTPEPTEPQAVRIESGGSALTTVDGKTWIADAYFLDGSTVDRGIIAIANTQFPRLYRTERYALTGYDVPVTNGDYTVNLHFAETYDGVIAAGQRVFNVVVQGQRINNLDVFKEAGGAKKALVKTLNVTVSNGVLKIRFEKVNGTPMIDAVELIKH